MSIHKFVILLCVPYVISQRLNLDEGSPCKWKGVSGRCVSVYRCETTFLDVMNKEYAPICSIQGKVPIICCTDCHLVNNTRNIIFDSDLGFLYKTGPKAKDKCLEYLHSFHYTCKSSKYVQLFRVYNEKDDCNDLQTSHYSRAAAFAYNGRNAVREEFPHMALLGYGDDVTSAQWLCGGSVISERFILTAAHCQASAVVGEVRFIALGILKRTDPQELWQHYNVKRIIAHPLYKSPSKYHDIMLLETDKEISFEGRVRPACLHTEGEAMETASATGWGALGNRQMLADTLQAIIVSRFNEEQCSSYYPPHRHLKNGYNHTTQMCYGDLFESQDTCEGDSGGPLQSKDYGNGCMYTILGVTSYGRQCEVSTSSGMYTRVYHYVPWIESIVWP